MIWITSDFHFGHEKDFLWQPRGFISWEDHAESVIKNYNEVVDEDDEVYILGDCVLKNDDFGIKCLKRLKGHKYLAVGNHDSNLRINKYEEANIFEKIEYGYRLKHGKYSIWLQHYPAMMGNYKKENPTICLAGHTHSPDKFQNMENCTYNVALDAHKCYPVSIDEVIIDIKEYRKAHPIVEYLNKSPYCDSCRLQYSCLAKTHHILMCPGYTPMN